MQPTDKEHERGHRSEARFFEAVCVRLPQTPKWLIAVEKAPPDLDLRGVDAVAYIKYPGELYIERVPIQIKSSWHAVSEYLEKHNGHEVESVLIMVMLERLEAHEVRRILYSKLIKIRRENIRYTAFFEQLLANRLSPRAEQVRERLLRARMRVPHAQKIRPVGALGPPQRKRRLHYSRLLVAVFRKLVQSFWRRP